MIYAYDEMYLDDAMKNLGEAADYAASCCNLNIDAFFELFVATGVASQFEKGISGKKIRIFGNRTCI